MILFNFSKNAVIFKTFYIYKILTSVRKYENFYHTETRQLICNTNQWTDF